MKLYSPSAIKEWFEKDKFTLESDFPNLPYIQDGDLVITESPVLLQFAALKTGSKDLLRKNEFDAVKIW